MSDAAEVIMRFFVVLEEAIFLLTGIYNKLEIPADVVSSIAGFIPSLCSMDQHWHFLAGQITQLTKQSQECQVTKHCPVLSYFSQSKGRRMGLILSDNEIEFPNVPLGEVLIPSY